MNDQFGRGVSPLHLWRIAADAAWTACMPFFGLVAYALAASRPGPERPCRPRGGGSRVGARDPSSGPWRDAASAQRQFEKCNGGVPDRVRSDSTLPPRNHPGAELIVHFRSAIPSGRGHREARAEVALFRASGRGAGGPDGGPARHPLTRDSTRPNPKGRKGVRTRSRRELWSCQRSPRMRAGSILPASSVTAMRPAGPSNPATTNTGV